MEQYFSSTFMNGSPQGFGRGVRLCRKPPFVIVGGVESPNNPARTGETVGMDPAFPLTIIIRHRKESPRKCSVYPLKGRPDLRFLNFPVTRAQDLDGYVRLSADGPPLSETDAGAGLLLLDASWRHSRAMHRAYADVPARSLSGWRSAFPRTSKRGEDPENGLASVEALFVAYHLLGRPTAGLLDHYRWAGEFLALNGLELSIT
jgi:pre-rRNA-processing protein TSR3